jgi:hypothetical protein
MPVLYKNNANSTLASGINAAVSGITLASGGGANFPVTGGSNQLGSDFFFVTITNVSDGSFEIVKVTARSGDVLTVQRGQEGTSAKSFSVGDRVELRITAELLDNLRSDLYEFYHSLRDFTAGTLIRTSIDYSGWAGDPWVLEIRGNSYGSLVPFSIQLQGYIYNDTIINHGGYSVGPNLTITAMNLSGKLCFWFARQAYWQGISVFCYSALGPRLPNRVTSVEDSANPNGAKQVVFSLRQVLRSDNYDSYALPLSGGTLTGTLLTAPGVYQLSSFPDGHIGFVDPTHTSGWGVGQGIAARSGDAIWALGSNGLTGDSDTLYLGIGSIAGGTFSTALSFTQNRAASFKGFVNLESRAQIKGPGSGNPTTQDSTDNSILNLRGTDALVRLQLGTRNSGNFAAWIQASYDNGGNAHGIEPLELNPLGGTVLANGNTVLNSGNYSGYALPLSGGTLTGKVVLGSAGVANDPSLRINVSTSSDFVHAQENIAANLTTGQHVINVFGKNANTKNAGYIGYRWIGDASNSNFVTIGHWGADDLFRVYPTGSALLLGALTAQGDSAGRNLYIKGTNNIIQFVDSSDVYKWEVVGRNGEFYIYKNDGTGSGYKYRINSSGQHEFDGHMSGQTASFSSYVTMGSLVAADPGAAYYGFTNRLGGSVGISGSAYVNAQTRLASGNMAFTATGLPGVTATQDGSTFNHTIDVPVAFQNNGDSGMLIRWYLSNNPNGGGSGNYRTYAHGWVHITTGWHGTGYTPQILNEAVESNSIGASFDWVIVVDGSSGTQAGEYQTQLTTAQAGGNVSLFWGSSPIKLRLKQYGGYNTQYPGHRSLSLFAAQAT